jgi:hypothetical protein
LTGRLFGFEDDFLLALRSFQAQFRIVTGGGIAFGGLCS